MASQRGSVFMDPRLRRNGSERALFSGTLFKHTVELGPEICSEVLHQVLAPASARGGRGRARALGVRR